MQQNQKGKSIINDIKLREEVALDLCEALNQIIKEEIKEYKEEDLYTEEEVRAWVNNPVVLKTYLDFKNDYSISNKLADKRNEYSTDQEYLYDKDEKENYFYNPNYNPSSSSDRNLYILMNLEDTKEADDYNQRMVNYAKNQDTARILGYELMDRYENVDPKKYTPTTELGILELSDEMFVTQQIGFGLHDQHKTFENYDPKLVERLNGNETFFQSNPKTQLKTKYQSILSILIPPKKSMMLGVVSSMRSSMFINYVKDNYSDIREFGFDNKDVTKDSIGFALFGSSSVTVNLILTENERINRMIDSGIIGKGSCTKYYFTDSKGNVAKFDDVKKHFIDGKLVSGYKRVEWTPEEIQDFETKKKGAYDNAKALEIEFLNQKLARTLLSPAEEKLVAPTNEFANLFREFRRKNKDVTDPLQRAIIISKFMEDNKELVDGIENIRNEVKIELQEAKEQEIEDISSILTSMNNDNKNLSYKDLNNKALEETTNIRTTELNDIINSYSNKENLKEICTSKFYQDEVFKNNYTPLKSFINKDDVIKSIGLINDITKSDEQYQKRNGLAKWWYRKSHDAMMHTKDTLINQLKIRGVQEKELLRIGKDDSLDISAFALSATKVVKALQEKYINNINDYHRENIKVPSQKIEELENQLNEIEASKELARNDFDKVRDSAFDEFVKKNPGLFEKNPNMKATEFEHMYNVVQRNKIREEFKIWRNKEENKEIGIKYSDAYGKFINENNKLRDCAAEIKERKTCLSEARKFDSKAFKIKRDEINKANQKPIEEVLADKFNNKGNIVIEQKKDELDKEINKDLGKSK